MRSHPFPPSIRLNVSLLIIWTLAACTATPQSPEPTARPAIPATTQPLEIPTTQPTPSITTSENGHTLTLVWQSEFTPEAAVGAGVDVTADEEGNVYVTSANVKKYDKDGKFVTQWGKLGIGEGEFNVPTGIAVDRNGNVYVDDFRNHRIQKFDSDGKFLLQWAPDPAGSPGSIAVDQDGNVYISLFQSDQDNIQKFDSNGKLLMTWGGTGTGDGQFSGLIEDIAIDQNGNLYVTDSYNHRIQKFDSNGNFLAKFGGEPGKEGRGLFYDPEGIAVDSQGNIYVVDSHFLQKLDGQGKFITQWPRSGDLDRAGFLIVDKQGDIYILARAAIATANGDPLNILFVKKFHQS
jgi:DNA-binding beta-propeller fold protein YncE